MALTNIELYEALKKDLNEDAARMIAEVVPPASELVTRDYFERRFAEQDAFIERRFAESERRQLRMTLALVGPLYATLIAGLVRLILKI